MKIVLAYQTSKGIFLDKDIALKFRKKEYDSYSYQKEYEEITEIWVLYDEESGNYFEADIKKVSVVTK